MKNTDSTFNLKSAQLRSGAGIVETLRYLLHSKSFLESCFHLRFFIIGAAISLVLAAAGGVLAVYFQSRFLGSMRKPEGGLNVETLFYTFLLSQLSFEVFQYLKRSLQNRLNVKLVHYLKSQIFQKSLSLDHQVFSHLKPGEVIQHFSSDAVQVGQIWGEGILAVLSTLILTIGVTIAVILEVGTPGIIFIFLLALLIYFAQKFSKLSSPLFKMRAEKSAERLAIIQEAVRSMTTLKMLGGEENFQRRIVNAAGNEEFYRLKASRLACIFFSIFATLRWVGWLLVLMWVLLADSSSLVNLNGTGLDPAGTIFALNWYSGLLTDVFIFLGAYLNFFQSGAVALSRIDAFLFLKKAPRESTLPHKENILLDLKDVSFSYADRSGAPALSHISLRIQEGHFLAIVGPVGSGKTTLLKLLLDDLPPTSGVIHRRSGLRASLVPQDSFLYSTTLRDSMRFDFRNDSAEDTHLTQILDSVQFTKDLEILSKGLDSWIGERGITLSGGQKQRASLARVAYFENYDAMFLDDPFSALDRNTFLRVAENLITDRWKGKTRVITTHRLEGVLYADEIIVLNEGVIEACGKHEDLLTNSTTYRNLWEKSKHAQIPDPLEKLDV